MPTVLRAPLLRVAVLAVLPLIGCAGAGKYTWVDDFKPAAEEPQYLLGPGDVLSVKVLNQEPMSGNKLKVRADGKVTLPLLGDVEVGNKTPADVAQLVTGKLKDLLQNPTVTVNVDEPRPFVVAVLGEVQKPGNYPLEAGAGVLQALASGGGLTQYAHDDGIYVLRKTDPAAAPVRIRFTYQALSRVEGGAATFRLRPRDVVVVE